jgi:hypothetical protein
MNSVRGISKAGHRGGPNSPEGRTAISHNHPRTVAMANVNNEPRLGLES